MKVFGNGPLPDRFINEAIISPDGSEFALPSDTTKLYIDWCQETNLEVIGFDVWLQGPVDITSLDHFGVKGNARYCLKEIECALNHPDVLSHNRGILFNVWVNLPIN